MNKADLINEVAEILMSRNDAKVAVDSIFNIITDALKGGEKVSLVGFGTFKVEERKARTGRNPKTGEPIQIEARKVPKFLPAKAMKDILN